MSIIIFAPQFAPFANPEAFVNNKLVFAFLEHTWHVDVISRNYASTVSYDYGSQWVEPWTPLRRNTHEVSYQAGTILTKMLDTLRCGLSLGHIIDGCRWARRALDDALFLHDESPYQVIISRAVPDSAHLPALVMSRKAGIPWIANWNDPPMMPPLVSEKIISGINARHRQFLTVVGEHADWHTFPTERMKNFMLQFLGADVESKCSVIPHCAFDATETTPHNSETFSLCYAGNIFADRYTEAFFKGLKRFVSAHSLENQVLLTIHGKADEGFLSRIDVYGLTKTIKFSGALSYANTCRELAKYTVLLILESPYIEGIFLPAKVGDYVTTGRPILAVSPVPGTLYDLFGKDGGGIAVNCLSEEDIYNGLCTLYNAWRDGELDYAYGSDRLLSQFSSETVISSYQTIFEKLGVAFHG